MLKVFHTADWHLGQSLLGFDRDFEHRSFLSWLLAQLKEGRPHALIISGDVFDSINPSAVSQRRFYSFVADAHAALPQLQIVVIAGNHDAAARLEAPGEALDSLNVTIAGTVGRNDDGQIDFRKFLVPLRDESGATQAIVLAVPFLRPSDVPHLADAADPYLEGIREFYRQAGQMARQMRKEHCPDAALIAMGHCHMHGGEESGDSERRVVIGGAEAVSAETFERDFVYVALGHLHKAQQFDGGRIRYSGSPIPLSFSEVCYRHRVLQVTLHSEQLVAVDDILIPASVAMLTVPKAGAAVIDDVLSDLQQLNLDESLPPEQHPFLEVRVLENGPDPTRRKRIEDALEGKPVRLASIKVTSPTKSIVPDDNLLLEAADLSTISPEEVFLSACLEKYGTEADESMRKAFREILLQEAQTS